jgi:hypothetical protein
MNVLIRTSQQKNNVLFNISKCSDLVNYQIKKLINTPWQKHLNQKTNCLI